MSWSHQSCAGTSSVKEISSKSIVVHWNGNLHQPLCVYVRTLVHSARILSGDASYSSLTEYLAYEPDSLRKPRAEYYLVWSSHCCTRSVQIRSQARPRRFSASRVGVIKREVRTRVHRVTHRQQPRPTRKQRYVWHAASAWLVLGAHSESRDDAVSHMAAF
jgi:hypothetical protein